MGLVVAAEERFRLGDIGPLGEPHSPPRVVLRNWMELRKVECNDSSFRSSHGIADLKSTLCSLPRRLRIEQCRERRRLPYGNAARNPLRHGIFKLHIHYFLRLSENS